MGGHGGGTTSTRFWYMWRFGWVFFLLALFFETVALFSGVLALCSRLASVLTGLIAMVALVFLTLGVSLMTATFVKMRDVFLSEGRDASLGRYAFGFGWGSWTALLISTVLFFLARRTRKDTTAGAALVATTTGRRRNWRAPWKRGTVNRTGYEGRRVKEEYV